MGAVDSDFIMKSDYAHPRPKIGRILLSHLMDTFKSPIMWIAAVAQGIRFSHTFHKPKNSRPHEKRHK